MSTSMREALEPFAKITHGIEGNDNDVWHRHDGDVLTVGDFRRARAALSSAPDRLSEAEQKAVEWLRTHQEQCDMDGVMVKVSRQAVDETLAIIDRLSCQPEAEPAAWGDSEGRERPIDAGAMKQLRLNPTTEAYWSRFSIPLYTSPRLDREKVLATLKPFADDANLWADTVPNAHRPRCTEPGKETAHPGSEAAFSVGDLRRARELTKAIMRETW